MKTYPVYAPICFIVYKRKEHIERVLASLKKNTLVEHSELYIFSDAAAKPEDEAGVEEVREYIKTIDGFKQVHIIERETNYSYNNISEGMTHVLRSHDRAIVLEDDLEVSPHFLEFMNDMLELYKDDDRVVCVEPGNYFDRENDHEFYFLQKLSSNGWGTWKNSWQWYERDGRVLWDQLRENDLFQYFDLDDTYTNTFQLSTYLDGKHKSWKIRFESSILLNNKLVVYSGKPLVFNFGNDGTGISGRTDQEYYEYDLFEGRIETSYKPPKLSHIGRERMKSFYKKLFKSSKQHRVAMRTQAILTHEPGHFKSLLQLGYVCLLTRRQLYYDVFKPALTNLSEIAPILQEVSDVIEGKIPSLKEAEIAEFQKRIATLAEHEQLQELEHAHQKYPTCGPIANDLAISYWNKGDEERGITLLSDFVEQHFPDPRACLTLYDMFKTKHDDRNAVDMLRLALNIDPNFPAALLEMGHVYFDAEETEKASWYYHQYLETDQTHPVVNRRVHKLNEQPYHGKEEFTFTGDLNALESRIRNLIENSPKKAFHVEVDACDIDEFMILSDFKRQGYITSISFTDKGKEKLPTVSVLMFTYDRLEYTLKTFERLLESTDYPYDLHIVDNHSTDGTVDWLKQIEVKYKYLIKSITYNPTNEGLPKPTNEFWERVETDLVGKIDNDTLVPNGWMERLVQAHVKSDKIGVVGGYHFRPEDFNEEDAQKKLFTENGIQVVKDTHIGGCCYLMKRSFYKTYGPMKYNPNLKTHGWTEYQNNLVHQGYIVGYLYPLVQLDYMDDPRSTHCLINEKYQEYTKKIWRERGVDFKSTDQLVHWLANDAQRVTKTTEPAQANNSALDAINSILDKTKSAVSEKTSENPPKAKSALEFINSLKKETPPRETEETVQEDEAEAYYEFDRPEVQALVPKNAEVVLDIGCGAGALGSGLKKKLGCYVVGIEYVATQGEKAKRRLDEVYIGDATKIVDRLKESQFDAVIMADFIEHIATPEEMLQSVKKLLKPNGKIILSIPNVRHWSVVKDLLEGRWEYEDAGILDRTHLKFFTLQSIHNVMNRNQLKIDECSGTKLRGVTVPKGFPEALANFGLNTSSLAMEGEIYQYLLVCSSTETVPQKTTESQSTLFPAVNDFSSDERPLVSIIFLAFNALKYTKECLESVIQYTHYPYEIICVDNHSTDGTTEYLREFASHYSHVTLIENKENKGFSGGNNQGVRKAKGKYVLLLNNDVVVSSHWLTELVRAYELDPDIGMVGPVTNYISGRQRIPDTHYRTMDEMHQFAAQVLEFGKNKITPRRRIAGFVVLMEKAVYDFVDGLDESYGIGNFEDDDLCVKVHNAGYALMVHEGVFIHHYGSRTFAENNIDMGASLKGNRKIFDAKWKDVDYEELLEIKNPLPTYEAELLNEGLRAFDEGHIEKAAQKYKEILEYNPIHENALYEMAQCLYAMEQYETAHTLLNKLSTLYPDNSAAYNLSGCIFLQNEQIEDARNCFRKAIEKDPTNADAQLNFAETQFINEDYDEAVKSLTTIIASHPNHLPTLVKFYQIYLEVEQYEDAETIKQRILNIDPNFHFES